MENEFQERNVDIEVDLINDYDMVPGARRPRIIMQTCAHISGAAYYYNQDLIANKQLDSSSNDKQSEKKVVSLKFRMID